MAVAGKAPNRLAQAWEWPAMGTTWRLYHSGGADPSDAQEVATIVAFDEARWSRFRPGSEVGRINSGAGSWVAVSPETQELVACARMWTAETCGVFQPLIGAELERWGYAVSVLEREPGVPVSPRPSGLDDRRVDIDDVGGRIRIPAEARIDLGGIAKSWCAVRAAQSLRQRCADPALLLDAGGDLIAVRGDHVIDIRHGADVVETVVLSEGHGVATSGCSRRQWRNRDGVAAHHLIDPARGAPGARTHATVLSPDPVAADVLATALAVRPALLGRRGEPCLVSEGSRRSLTAAWEDACLPT